MKKILGKLFNRVIIAGVIAVLQMVVLAVLIWKLSSGFIYVYSACMLLSSIIVVWLVNKNENPTLKLSWVIMIMLLPVFLGFFYLILGSVRISKRQKRRMDILSKKMEGYLPEHNFVIEEVEKQDRRIASQFKYIQRSTAMPPYKGTKTCFFSSGEAIYEKILEKLKEAKHFIFLQYFTIAEGKMWDSILNILKQKVHDGVDVRVMYDDLGCLGTLPPDYCEKLRKLGIKCVIFNPIKPILNVGMQNRDHRKIAIVDGHTAFTGGVNLSDEYINAKPLHGYWKDHGILLFGEAVWSLTLLFLQSWNYYQQTDDDYSVFSPSFYADGCFEDDGYVQPFGDSPLDDERVGESVYLNMINNATNYLYICTPYLILDNEMITALSIAVKRGVDVCIVTPHVPDKWYVHLTTRSYYAQLVESGVRIYEYLPGFIHAKTFVSDDQVAVTGTINLDYRSLYHHFECGVLCCDCSIIPEIKNDFLKTLKVSAQITKESHQTRKWYMRLAGAVLRLAAPLM